MMDFEDYKKAGESYRKKLNDHYKKCNKTPPDSMKKESTQHHDHPNTMENGPATLLYIFTMIGGSIFYDRVGIWICATIIFLLHLFRHRFRK